MKIMIINSILYTSETSNIPQIKSIKDTMIYDLCLAFYQEGHEVVLCAADSYRPIVHEDYPFKVIWGKCILKKIFKPHRLPLIPSLIKILRDSSDIDLIICSELFSFNTLFSYYTNKNKTLCWHELAKHNNLLFKIPSKIWYTLIVKVFMKKLKVVCRSLEALNFASMYSNNVLEEIIDHGVNMDKFSYSLRKDNYFVVCSQLIKRKRIDRIIVHFKKFIENYNNYFKLYIIGDGDEFENLKQLTCDLQIEEKVLFMGKMNHNNLIPILRKANAMLVNTVKDNSMVSIVESLSVCTPVITTSIPLNSSYIKKNQLGIVKDEWNEKDLENVVMNSNYYIRNCLAYRDCLSSQYRVKQFIYIFEKYFNNL